MLKGESVNLGRVLDKERGIFRSRERGVFTYDLKTGQYGAAPADFIEPAKRRKGRYIKDGRRKRSLLVLQFGDIFFYDYFVRGTGILKAVDAIGYSNKDTLHALLCYYVTSSESNSRAEFWYSISYAQALYPMATMASQRISDALAEIGLEENRRLFYHKYIEFVTGCRMNNTKGSFSMIPDGGEGKMLPVDIHHEDTLRGHLIMTLLSTTILKILQDRLLKTKLSTSEVFSVLSHQGALVYPNSLITSEPVKKMNDIYKHFKLKCPEEIPYTPTEDECARM